MRHLDIAADSINRCSHESSHKTESNSSSKSSPKSGPESDQESGPIRGPEDSNKRKTDTDISGQVTCPDEGLPQAGVHVEYMKPFFQTPTFQALTVGLPFCIFKLLFGLLALRAAAEEESEALAIFGWALIIWAGIDLFMNLARIVFHLWGKESPIEYCTIAQAGRLIGRPRLFLAVDTLISFSIICFVLWSGWIADLSRMEAYLWYAATTMNLISVSLVSIWSELHRPY